MQNLWQTHYQIFSIISLKEIIKLHEDMDMIIKNMKKLELNTNVVSTVLNTQILKMIY